VFLFIIIWLTIFDLCQPHHIKFDVIKQNLTFCLITESNFKVLKYNQNCKVTTNNTRCCCCCSLYVTYEVLYQVKYVCEGQHITWLTYGMFSELPWPNWIVNRNREFVSARRQSFGRIIRQKWSQVLNIYLHIPGSYHCSQETGIKYGKYEVKPTLYLYARTWYIQSSCC